MASRSLNKVILIGNLTRDPELRYTPTGTAVCTFGLATNRSWTTQTGETKEDTEFHRIVSWNKLAELCAQLLAKGRKVYVEGRLSTHAWTGQDGAQRTSTEIVIEDMIILDSKRPLKEGEQITGEAPVKAATPTPVVVVPEVDIKSDVATQEVGTPAAEDKTVQGAASQPAASKKSSKKKTEETKVKEAKGENKGANEEITPDDIPF